MQTLKIFHKLNCKRLGFFIYSHVKYAIFSVLVKGKLIFTYALTITEYHKKCIFSLQALSKFRPCFAMKRKIYVYRKNDETSYKQNSYDRF